MMILLGLLCVVLVGVAMVQLGCARDGDGLLFAGWLTVLFPSAFGLLGVFQVPFSQMDGAAKVTEFKAFEETVQRARADETKVPSDIERAALACKIAEWNSWLASEQYWNGTVLDIWHTDRVMELRPIR